MNNIIALVRETIKQRDALCRASSNDSAAMQLWRQEIQQGRRNRDHNVGHRRIWTRRDKRLFDASDDGWTPGARVLALVRWYARRPMQQMMDAAIDEAVIFERPELIPILREIAAAHGLLQRHFADHASNREPTLWWEDAQKAHDGALKHFAITAPDIDEKL